ncbi:hypothetical protein BGX28_009934 [Mortierella sp. GBA30]|nr:hypothetical protein BGX28_009934 [Mortierella sp. GBA30]
MLLRRFGGLLGEWLLLSKDDDTIVEDGNDCDGGGEVETDNGPKSSSVANIIIADAAEAKEDVLLDLEAGHDGDDEEAEEQVHGAVDKEVLVQGTGDGGSISTGELGPVERLSDAAEKEALSGDENMARL